MQIDVAGAPAPGRQLRSIFAGLVLGLISTVLTVSLAAVVFSGPLRPLLGQGVQAALLGSVVLGLTGAFALSYRGSVFMPQDITAIILSVGATGLAGSMGAASPAEILASVLVFVALGTALVGLVFAALGLARLGMLARFVPFPVLGGFLAATGYLLCVGAVRLALDAEGAAGPALRLGPTLLVAAAMLVVARRFPGGIGLPLFVAAGFVAFFAGLALSGVGLSGAADLGLLLGIGAEPSSGALLVLPGALAAADYGAILGHSGSLIVLVGMASVAALLNASALEVATGVPVDLDRDLRALGGGNLLAALVGGLPGYQIFGETLLGHRLVGEGSRWIGLLGAATCGATLLAGPDLIGILPLWIIAGMLGYLGLDLLYQWLWVARREMPLQDFAIVVLIVAITAAVGYLQAVAIGLLAACALFILAFARIDVVRTHTTAAVRRSRTERGPAASAVLDAEGSRVCIVELEGYLFFGTAARLNERLTADLAGCPRDLVLAFERVSGADMSAVSYLDRLMQAASGQGVRLHLAGLGPRLAARLRPLALAAGTMLHPSLDAALTAIEEDILASTDPDRRSEAAFADLLRRSEALGLAAPFGRREVAQDAVLMAQGAPSDGLVFLESGRLVAHVADDDGRQHLVATFLPGAVVGEIGFLGNLPRTASVTALVPSRIRCVTRADLDRLARRDPDLVREFEARLAALLARRLARTTALLARLGR